MPTAMKDGIPMRYTRDGTIMNPPPTPMTPASVPTKKPTADIIQGDIVTPDLAKCSMGGILIA
ncbi:unnamed protein product [marine sediment metagenome]|uniref:Uncharacterized protein n=1 Tax=marine sediment metagenome TaxID=412755 RepID=X1U3W2_9ZZZZ